MAQHLIKRKDVDFDFKDGWCCETSINKWPSGIKVSEGDVVYVAQNGYAIYGKGIVEKVIKFEFSSFVDFVKYALNNSNVIDDNYWISKLKEYSNKIPISVIKVLEYKLTSTECFEYTIPLEDRFLKQSSWYYLEDSFKIHSPENIDQLTLHIPTKIRSLVYHLYKIVSKDHIIDIDHFVPRSISGPGNIIENLIPISASINRRKSNHIPSKLLDLAKQFGLQRPKNLIVSHDKFYSDRDSLSLGKKIVEKINKQPITDLRSTYRIIRDFHFPYLSGIKNE
jgi:hypothetical protein